MGGRGLLPKGAYVKSSFKPIKVGKNPNGKKVLNTSGGTTGFSRTRRYDTDLNRLSRGSVQNELASSNINVTREMNKEMRNLKLM